MGELSSVAKWASSGFREEKAEVRETVSVNYCCVSAHTLLAVHTHTHAQKDVRIMSL